MTLRGGIRAHIDTLPKETATSYKALIKELIPVYHQGKNRTTKRREWNAIVWKPQTMSIPRLGAVLLTKYKSFSILI